MKRSLQLRRRALQHEQGYILLALLLMVAVMAIVAMAAMPKLQFEMQRDREEEMIHRGAQYANAIRRFYKKFGRYPTKIEDLENSNNIKFLRKRYKDPMNCKAGKCADFKVLYFSDVQSVITGFGGGGMIPGANPIGGAAGATAGGLGSGGSSPFGQSSFGQSSPFGGTSGSGFGNSSSSGQNSFGQNSFGQNSGQNSQTPGQNQTNPPTGTDSSQAGASNTASTGQSDSSSASGTSSSSSSPSGQPSNQLGASGQVIGGPIVGVASALKSDESTIREFNHKKKYKDWLFVYDPMQDKGQLITSPYQPQMQGTMPNQNGMTPAGSMPGTSGSAFGQPGNSGFGGSGSGFGNSGFGNSNSGFGNSNPQPSTPPSPPQQQ